MGFVFLILYMIMGWLLADANIYIDNWHFWAIFGILVIVDILCYYQGMNERNENNENH